MLFHHTQIEASEMESGFSVYDAGWNELDFDWDDPVQDRYEDEYRQYAESYLADFGEYGPFDDEPTNESEV